MDYKHMPFNYSLKRLLTTSSHYIPYYPFVQNNDLYENSAKIKIIKVL